MEVWVDKLKMESKDLVNDNIDKIQELFPGLVTESTDKEGRLVKAIDFDLLKQELSDKVVEGEKERYQLTWPGKKKAMLMANLPTTKTLRPAREESVDWDKTENLFIEGDNLEALKILQESYLNQVKCIYIDPPYNTGNDFIYKDDFRQSRQEYLDQSGQVDEEGNRLFQNNESNGRFHSDWLSMMYPRLKLARNLLREDGVIFISIDDGEVANLKMICDEVFGEKNFIGEFLKQSKIGGGSDSRHIATEHEYVLCYSKNISFLPEMFEAHNEEYLKRYKEQDEKGKYFWDTFARPGLKNPINYDIIAPDGTIINGDWIWSKARFEQAYKNNEVRIIKKINGAYTVHFKQYLNLKGKKPRSMTTDFGGTFDGKKEVASLLNSHKIFSYPKSTKHIKKLLEVIAVESKDIILDFFAGSSTAAHAVMQLNAEDRGKRKYIMVQLPEPCPPDSEAHKAGYKNIAEISKKRIRRAASKIKEVNGADIDYGFRVFKVDSSNMKDVYHHPNQITQDGLQAFETNIKKERSAEDLLIQVMLDSGLQPSLPMEKKIIQGKEVFFVAGNSLVACFDKEIPEQLIHEIAENRPLRVVFQDKSFMDDAARINVDELFKTLSPGTEVKVI
jgi:adenine-specific DNA-methyltransferase